MKKFISFLIALFAILTIQAQQYSLDKSFINTCVVQQHIDVGVTIQSTFQNIYTTPTSFPVATYYVSETNLYVPRYVATTSNLLYCTSYTGYRRGVGLINDNVINRNTYIQTTNLIEPIAYSQDNYKNVQRYYCND